MKKVTILLPNFNNEKVLPVTFCKLRENLDCSRIRFLMVDDGSEDDSVNVAKKYAHECGFASCEIIERDHQGIVHTLNYGLSCINTEFVVRIDGDATVETPDWVNLLLRWFDSECVGIVGGQVIWENGTVHSFGRNVISENGLFDLGCIPLEVTGNRTFDSIVYRPRAKFLTCPPFEVDSILGVCVAFRLEDAKSIGSFDSLFNPVWIEDDDFGLSIRKHGKKNIVDPRVMVIHRPSLRGSREPRLKEDHSIIKNTQSENLLLKTAKRIVNRIKTSAYPKTAEPHIDCIPTFEDFFPKESNPWRSNILLQHYTSWKTKWGFDPLNPKMGDIFERYWDSQVCWKTNPKFLDQSMEFFRRSSNL